MFAAAGAALVAVYLALRASPYAGALLYEACSIGAVAAVAWSVRRRLSTRSRAWPVLAAAVAAFAVGDLLWTLEDVLGVALPTPYLVDAAYLATYPLFAWALLAFSARRREPIETTVRQALDAAVLFIAAFCPTWFLLIDPIVDRRHLGGSELVLTIAYPTCDLAVLALAARFAFSSGRFPPAYRLLTAGFFVMFVGDLMWRVGLSDGSYVPSSWINALFMGGYVLWGTAALHPSAVEIDRFGVDAAAARPRAAWRRLLLLVLAVSVPAAVLVVSRRNVDDATDIAVFAMTVLLLPLLSLARVGDMLRALHELAADLDAVIAASPVAMCVVDREGVVQLWNGAAEQTSGYAAAEVVGHPPPVVAADDPGRVAAVYADALRGIAQEQTEVRLLDRDGKPIELRVSTAPLRTGDGRIVALFEDVTERRRQERTIAYLANHDPLTGLPNRRAFERLLADAAVDAASRRRHLILVDVDDFKSVNDTAGHPAGDRMLRELARLLQRTIRADGVVSRLSGDEFAVLLGDASAAAATAVANRIVAAARDYRLRLEDRVLDVTVSAGIYPLEPGERSEIALRRADEALYRAKAHGRNRAERWHSDPMRAVASSRRWSPIIKDALADDRLEPYAQPIVALADEQPVYYELLCRLRLTDGSPVDTAEWIEAAERLGLMPAVDARMLEKARTLLTAQPALRLFVNISPSSFDDSDLLGLLERTLAGLPPHALGIEITEHTTLSDLERSSATLDRLRRLGALVAIDDFGLGFTSFSELATLPCDIVKIPASFSPTGGDSTDSSVIAGAITSVAHCYGKQVVVEGVETAASAGQAKLLRIEYAQGWHYGRPAPVAEVAARRAGSRGG